MHKDCLINFIMQKVKIENPFIIKGAIPEDYFCDRTSDLRQLEMLLRNGHNIVLTAPRRIGKTALVEKCFNEKSIRDSYDTFTIDIMETSSLREFTFLIGKKVFEKAKLRGKDILDKLLLALKSISASLGYDPVTQSPVFSIGLGDILSPEKTLDELFTFLETSSKPNILMIDEFQQIAEYQDGSDMEAILRSRIQKMRNTSFIFSGSEYSLLGRVFSSPKRPFYKSATPMELSAIPQEEYRNFAVKQFSDFRKKLNPNSFDSLFSLFDGFTFYVHYTLNVAFMLTDEGEECDKNKLLEALRWILDREDTTIKTELSNLTLNQKNLLYSIADEGEASGLTSENFMLRHGLRSTSIVQSAARSLEKKKIISRIGGRYYLNDKFEGAWIIDHYLNGLEGRLS